MKNPLPWLTIGICCALLLPTLFMDGMFMDGVLYSSVSKNYAHGLGTFWEQYYSAASGVAFHEQPPLMFFLQGQFFKLLGDSIYTERIYSLIAALICSGLIYRCWKIIQPSSKTGWLPVLFWFTIPITFYAFINNLEECTMSVFVLAATVHLLRALHTKQGETLHLILAGLMILLAGLTKGVQGMFLLAAPFVWFISVRDKNFMGMIRQSFLVALVPVLFVIYAWFVPAVHSSFAAYFSARFVATFNHSHDTSGSRFHILFELLQGIIGLLVMLGIILFTTKNRFAVSKGWRTHKKLILFFACVAVTGIFPLMITLEQRGFYLVPALPFIAFAAALIVAPNVELMRTRLKNRRKLTAFIRVFGMLLTVGAIVSGVLLAGKPKRDRDKLEDLALIASQTGENEIIAANHSVKEDWGLNTYAMRKYGITIKEDLSLENEWLLLQKADTVPEGFQQVSISTSIYNLYRKAR